MKVGDTFPVTVAGHTVGEAYVEAVDFGGSEATIVVPGVRVRMAVATSLAPKVETPAVETVIDGVQRAGNNEGPVTSEDIPAAQEAKGDAGTSPAEPSATVLSEESAAEVEAPVKED